MDNAFEFSIKNGATHTEANAFKAYCEEIILAERQACTAHHEAERNALLAVIAQKDKALRKIHNGLKSHFDAQMLAVEALALTPNIRLVEVDYVDSTIGYVLNPAKMFYEPKLYTIEKGE